jgi:hypothetical protein
MRYGAGVTRSGDSPVEHGGTQAVKHGRAAHKVVNASRWQDSQICGVGRGRSRRHEQHGCHGQRDATGVGDATGVTPDRMNTGG